jgi:uncharacterized membrane protein YbhN (UPF0104 family)
MKATLFWVLVVLVAAVLLRYSLRGIDWKRVGTLLSGAQWQYVTLGLLISTVSLTLRAVRWRLLLCAGGNVLIGTAFWATAAGYFGNSFLPARAGELVRTLMVSSRSELSKTYVLTTALSERVSDAVALLVISATILAILPYRPGWLADASKPFAAVAFIAVLTIALLPKLEPLAERILTRMPLSQAVRNKMIQLLASCLQALRSFHDLRRLLSFVAMTAVIWTLDATCSHRGCEGARIIHAPECRVPADCGPRSGQCRPIDARLCRHLSIRGSQHTCAVRIQPHQRHCLHSLRPSTLISAYRFLGSARDNTISPLENQPRPFPVVLSRIYRDQNETVTTPLALPLVAPESLRHASTQPS